MAETEVRDGRNNTTEPQTAREKIISEQRAEMAG